MEFLDGRGRRLNVHLRRAVNTKPGKLKLLHLAENGGAARSIDGLQQVQLVFNSQTKPLGYFSIPALQALWTAEEKKSYVVDYLKDIGARLRGVTLGNFSNAALSAADTPEKYYRALFNTIKSIRRRDFSLNINDTKTYRVVMIAFYEFDRVLKHGLSPQEYLDLTGAWFNDVSVRYDTLGEIETTRWNKRKTGKSVLSHFFKASWVYTRKIIDEADAIPKRRKKPDHPPSEPQQRPPIAPTDDFAPSAPMLPPENFDPSAPELSEWGPAPVPVPQPNLRYPEVPSASDPGFDAEDVEKAILLAAKRKKLKKKLKEMLGLKLKMELKKVFNKNEIKKLTRGFTKQKIKQPIRVLADILVNGELGNLEGLLVRPELEKQIVMRLKEKAKETVKQLKKTVYLR